MRDAGCGLAAPLYRLGDVQAMGKKKELKKAGFACPPKNKWRNAFSVNHYAGEVPEPQSPRAPEPQWGPIATLPATL